MKRLFSIILILLLVAAGNASDSRLFSLGINSNYFIQDYTNVTLFPTALIKNPDVVYVNGNLNYAWNGGIHYQVFNSLLVGMRVTSELHLIDYSDTGINIFSPFGYPNGDFVDDGYDVFFAYHLQKNLGLGLQFTYKESSYSTKDSGIDDSKTDRFMTWYEFAGGAYIEMSNILWAEFSARYITRNFERNMQSSDPNVLIKPDGHSTLQFDGRLSYEWKKNTTIVPYANFSMVGAGAKNNLGSSINEDIINLTLGVANVITLDNQTVIFGGLGLRMSNTTWEEKLSGPNPPGEEYNVLTLPFLHGGVDAPLSKYFNFRFAFYKLLTSVEEIDPYYTGVTGDEWEATTEEFTEKPFGAVIGMSMKFKNYEIDLVFGDNIFGGMQFGPFSSGGYMGGNGVFSRVSVNYFFGRKITENTEEKD